MFARFSGKEHLWNTCDSESCSRTSNILLSVCCLNWQKRNTLHCFGHGRAREAMSWSPTPSPPTSPQPHEHVLTMQENRQSTWAPYVCAADQAGSSHSGFVWEPIIAIRPARATEAFANVRFGMPEALGAIRHAAAQIAPLGFVGLRVLGFLVCFRFAAPLRCQPFW